MAWLIQAEASSARHSDRGQQSPALVGGGSSDLHALSPQFLDGGVDVVTQEVQLVAGCIGWMRSNLGGREREDEPTVAAVDQAKPRTLRRKARVASASVV
jgi:hypothetical protein